MQKQNSLTFHWLFPDQIQFFTDQNTAVLRPICLLAADKWQIPFTSSLKCTSLILQMKQIKSLNSFLAQNVLKLTSFHSSEWVKQAREKINTFKKSTLFFTFQIVKIPATHVQHIFWAKIMKFPDFSLTFLVFKISLTNFQNSLTFPWPWRKIKFPWPVATQKTEKKLHGYDLESIDSQSPLKGANFSVSDSGWTKDGIGKLWFTQTFLPNIGLEPPQLLICDVHNLHNNIEFITLARDNIIIMELPNEQLDAAIWPYSI